MRPLWILFGLGGRIARPEFAAGLAAAVLAFWVGITFSAAALPWMAELLAPHGINAGFALNAIWLTMGAVFVWSAIALGAKRLRDRSRSPWWIVVVVVPLAALALLNDAVFLLSKRLFVPPQVQVALLIDSCLIGLWVLFECLFLPTRIALTPQVSATPGPTPEGPKSSVPKTGNGSPMKPSAPPRPGATAPAKPTPPAPPPEAAPRPAAKALSPLSVRLSERLANVTSSRADKTDNPTGPPPPNAPPTRSGSAS